MAPDELLFDLRPGFDPFSLQFAKGPKSMAQNAGRTALTVVASMSHCLTSLLALHVFVKFAS